MTLDILIWRILRKTKVFDYWYDKHLTELLFDLELMDIERKEITQKYLDRLHRLNFNNKYPPEAEAKDE